MEIPQNSLGREKKGDWSWGEELSMECVNPFLHGHRSINWSVRQILEGWSTTSKAYFLNWFAKSVTKFGLVISQQILQCCGGFGSGLMMAAVVTKNDSRNCLEMSLQGPAWNGRRGEWHLWGWPFSLAGRNLLLLRLVLIVFASHHPKYSQFPRC